jgi:hypothetical protein
MDLTPTPEQAARCDRLSSLLSDSCGPDLVRSSEPLGFDPDLWKQAVAIGLLEPLRDDDGLVTAVLAAEILGASLAPIPFAEVAVALDVLRWADTAAAANLAARSGGGGDILTVALWPPGRHGRIVVPAGAVADVVLSPVGDDWVALAPTAGMVEVLPNLGCAPIGLLDREAFAASPLVLTGGASRVLQWAQAEWSVLTAASLVGLAARAVELGCDYARQRQAFGSPIGAFQGVAHPLASVATAVDGARLLAWKAAWAAAAEPAEFPTLAAMAFGFATETARNATTTSLRVHGGNGYTKRWDIELFYRRAMAWPLVAGDPRRTLRQVGDLLYGEAG